MRVGVQDAPRRTSVGGVLLGRLYLFSGRDGRLLFTVDGQAPELYFSAVFAPAGDFDGDGRADVLVTGTELIANRGVNNWHVVSGRTRQRLATFRNYDVSAVVGDVNGDRFPDILFGRHELNTLPRGMGRAFLVSGKDGSTIYGYSGTYQQEGFGTGVAAAGDLDGDGAPDLLIGAHGDWPWTPANGIWAHSGRTGALLFRITGQPPTDSFPAGLAGVGDVNGDGFDDIAVSEYGIRQSRTRPNIEVFSGPAGQHLLTIPSPLTPAGPWARSVVGIGDLDGDGFDDIAADGFSPNAFVFSGRDGSVLSHIQTLPREGISQVGAIGDTDGDDFPDLLVAPVYDPVTQVLRVRLYSCAPTGVSTLGTGCADARGVVPRIGCTFVPTRGQRFTLNLSRVGTGLPAALILGASSTRWQQLSLPFELTAIGMPGCWLRTSADVVAAASTSGPPAKGHASVPLTIPNDPALAGQSFFAQWLVLEPPSARQPATVTRALKVTVQ